ncbi:MAG: dTDP-4-dehydrorhamnose reductase [Firmicutes bacterium]|nr:dTDP-4-dehydrorhamnose reductase [Bacillota bacterium]
MSAILVIGASGFLGRHLMSCCPGKRKLGTYHLHESIGMEFLDLQDLRQIRQIIKRVSPSVVIYAAGMTDVDACEKNPEMACQINAHAVAEIATISTARIVYISTDYVFDGSKGFYREEDEVKPLNIYGASKVAGEQAVLAHNRLNLVVRVSGLYDDGGMKRCNFSSPIKPVIMDDIRISSPVHVADVASAIDRLLEIDNGGIYHVAGPDALSRYEFSQLVSLRCSEDAMPSAPRKTLALRPRDSSLSTQRMQSLGWQARPASYGLPTLKHTSSDVPSHCSTERQGSLFCEGLLIDCVGGLLTRRTWLPKEGLIVDIDKACAKVLSGPEFWRTCARSAGLEDAEVFGLQEKVAFRYAPNPPVWSHLRRWRTRYKLALVNNGPSATFRRWVQKYGLDQIFDVLANSEELGVRKPNKEFFECVMSNLGLRPDRCVLIDDDVRNIDHARCYGLRTVQTEEFYNYPLSIHEWNHESAGQLISGVEPHV